MSVKLSRYSRLLFGELLRDSDGKEFFDLLTLPPLEPQSDDTLLEVTGSDRLDSIAKRVYGDDALQWVLAHANGIELWPTQVHPGMILRVPSSRYVLQVWLPKATPRTR